MRRVTAITTNNLPTKNTAKLVTVAIALFVFLISPFARPLGLCQEQSQPALRTLNDIFTDVGRRVPAFGGMFVDETKDTLYIYMVPGQGGDVGALDRAITEVFGTGRPPEHQLQVLPGQYTFLQLKDWDDNAGLRVLSVPGAVQSGIDHARNRLEVGVTSQAAFPMVEAELRSAGVPRDAVILEQVEPVREVLPDTGAPAVVTENPGTCDTRTLRDRCRPLVGGLEIQVEQGSANITRCTLGFNATRNEVRGFVTAGHCIVNESDPKSAIFFQPSVAQNNRVGVGDINPPFFTMAQNKRCFAGQTCRFSDSMFVKLDNGVEGTVGEIAQPEDGSSDWDGVARFSIVEKFVRNERRSVSGTRVTRVGSQTGRIDGTIRLQDFRLMSNGKTFISQIEVDWGSRPPMNGDSGAPVFMIRRGTDGNQVTLVGLLWGDRGVSPIENIELTDELGPTLLVCLPGWEC